MPKIVGYSSEAQTISGNDGSWIVDKNAVIHAIGSALIEELGSSGNSLKVMGSIFAESSTTSAASTAVTMQGTESQVEIARTAVLTGRNGVIAYGADSEIVNAGVIAAEGGLGMEFYCYGESGSVVNRGTVSGATGIYLYGSGATAENEKTGHVIGDTYGVRLVSAGGEGMTLTNAGIISVLGSGYAVMGSGQDDVIVNSGFMDGNIDLGDGNDSFDGRKGTVEGTLSGGLGNDKLTTSRADLLLTELSDQGYDTVKSSVSYTLNANVEQLILTGKKAIDGTGTDGDNDLTGNAGKNVLDGMGGVDWISGGNGADVLTGGDGNDFFIMSNGFGKDKVTDFTDGEDHLVVTGSGITSYEDLDGKILDKGDDVWVVLSKKDVLILQDVDFETIGEDDFTFTV